MTASTLLGKGMLVIALAAGLTLPAFADSMSPGSTMTVTPVPMTTTTYTMSAATQALLATPDVDYTILADPWFNDFDIKRAETYGLSDNEIAGVCKIAHNARVPMGSLIDRIEEGATLPDLCDENGLPLRELNHTEGWRHRLHDYKVAYDNSGFKGYRAIHWAYVAESADLLSRVAGYSATIATQDIFDTLNASGNFTILVRALRQSGISGTLATGGPYTIFAPTDAAFAKLGQSQVDALMSNPNQLAAVLNYHILPGRVMSADIAGMSSPTTPNTLQGTPLSVTSTNGAVMVNGMATVTQADIPASNGVIHSIDTVLMPQGMAPAPAPAPVATPVPTTPDNSTPAVPDNSMPATPTTPAAPAPNTGPGATSP